MVADPISYSVTIAAIAFFGFSIRAIAGSFTNPPVVPEVVDFLTLPEPIQPIGLLPPASPTKPLLPAESMPPVTIQMGDRPDNTPAAQPLMLLPSASMQQPNTPTPPPSLPPTSDLPMLYCPALLGQSPETNVSIPSPWEQESDRYWSHNATLTYPNVMPNLLRGANE
ncbi:MAG: hypothetical protein SNJ57_09360 [Cyanobacteriota bacterium]